MGTRTRTHELAVLLRLPGTSVAAVDRGGFRVAAPASLGRPEGRAIPLPLDRATMLDLVVPGEGLLVIRAWEQAVVHGRAHRVVHLRDDPDTGVDLTFLDLVAEHGVLVAVVSPTGSEAPH